MKRKFLIIASLVLIFGLVLFLWNSQAKGKKSKDQIKFVRVEKKNLIKSVSASGKIASGKEVELKFQASGQLTWVGVKLGDYVKPWQAIAQLDKRELELTLQKYLRDYSKERWDFEEDKQVTYRNTALTDTIKRILEKNQYDLDKAVMDVEIKDLALKFATLVTPIGGIITQIDAPVAGINITPATAVFKVSDPNDLLFKADVDETDISRIKEGQEVEITFDAYPEDVLKSRVIRVDFVAKTTSGGSTAFSVEVKLPENKNLKYKLGMNGDIEIIEKKVKQAIVIPIESLHQEKNQTFVYLKENDLIKKQKIKTGLETETKIQVTDGLKEGQKVVLSGWN